MKTISEMRNEIAEIMGDLGKQKGKIESENREPTSEERARAHDLLDRVDELKNIIQMEERIQATADGLAKPKNEPTRPPVSVNSLPENEQRKRDRFLSFGEQLVAVRNAETRKFIDPRLLNTRAAQGLNESVSSEGAFLVQSDFSPKLLDYVFQTGKLISMIDRIPISGNSNGVTLNGIDESSRANGSRWGGIQMYWEEEAATKTKSKPKFRNVEMKLKKMIGLCYATDELLEDSAALEAIITNRFQKEMAFKLDDGIINGTGAGQMLGIMNSPATVTVNKESGQDATTIQYENITKMWSRLLPDAHMDCVWLINVDCFPELAKLSVPVGTGGSVVYVPPGGASASPYASLLGRPVIPMEQCQTLGTSGDIILFSPSGYLFADKGGMKQDISIHVQFVTDQTAFRFVYRCDGQPALAKPITPYKGTNTLSYFVKLQTRS